jgi:beta-glucosidase
VANLLFGEVNPSGRLPVTFYASTADLPAFDDYSMANRTYRYFSGKPLFAFGHGLSFTQFEYSNPTIREDEVKPDGTVHLSFSLKNVGSRDGDEVPQVYFRHVKSAVPQAQLALCGFSRVHLVKGDSTNVTVNVPATRFRYWDTKREQYVVEPGQYEVLIGSASDDIRSKAHVTVSAKE